MLVHSHWLLPQGFTGGLAAKLLGRPHVTTVHGSDVFALRGAISNCFKRIAVWLADAVTVNSEATRAAVQRLAPRADKLVRIPMGATASAGAIVDRNGAGPVLAFVGRLVPEKGVSDLLQSVKLLADSAPQVAAVVIGDGPARADLEAEATRLGIAHRVRFAGWLSQDGVQRELRSADIFVGPSRPAADGTLEGQGLALAEAMLAGLPVVASAIGGITDAVRHGETGLLVSPGRPQEIAEAVRRLVADRDFASRLAVAARAFAAAELTREVSARRFAEVYARLTGAPAASPAREKK
jgi:glycosyltransferase involved in cell wall biosynthesis